MFPTSKKSLIWSKTTGSCAYCGGELDNHNFTVDHIIPRALGGTNDIQNLLPACNTRKGTKSIEEFRRFVAMREATGETIFGQTQVFYLLNAGLFPILGAEMHMTFHFERIGESA